MPGVLNVEGRHIGESIGVTCERCVATGLTLREVPGEIRPIFPARRIRITVHGTVLPPDRIGESNILLFKGAPLEDLIKEVRIESTTCPSCARITGTDAECRARLCGDQTYEEMPAERIRRTALEAAGR